MPRPRFSEVSVGIAIASAFWVIVLVWSSAPIWVNQICEKANDEAGYECTTYGIVAFLFIKITKFFDAATIGAVATAVIAWFTITLTRIGRRQVEDTKILQRAYISVEPQGVKSLSAELGDEHVVAHIGIHNVGHLPARRVRWVIKGEVNCLRYRQDFPVSMEEAFGSNIVPPGTVMTQGSDRFDLADAEAMHTKEGPFLYIWGAVYYQDGFDDSPPRTTLFCHRYNFENTPSGDVRYFFRSEQGRIHRYGNDST